MAGTLFIVGTPIGNLDDITVRAARTLNHVDFIAAEDTRVTIKLLSYLGIKKPMVSYFEHNKKEKGNIICNRIVEGQNCALVSDAGMPCISDPGTELVNQAYSLNINVRVIPGPSAVISAISLSGMPAGRFTFEGFLSMNKKRRMEHLNSLINETRAMVFYEAPHKLRSTLKDLYTTLGDRSISIIKEITKIHENVVSVNLKEATSMYIDIPKGEFVLIIEGKQNNPQQAYTLAEAVKVANSFIKEGKSVSEASKLAAKLTHIQKSSIYKIIAQCSD